METRSKVARKKQNGSRRESRRDRVQALLRIAGTNANVLVLISPDPDSIASAMVVKRLLWKHVRKTVIAYPGEIKRLDNLAMIELLKIPLAEMAEIEIAEFSKCILVDSQPDHADIFRSLKFDAIIDHHPVTRPWDASHVDIRPEYGASATMMTEYLRGAGIPPSKNLATALLYGIKTDTDNFERGGTEQDVKQFQYLFKFANMNILKKIERSEFRVEDLSCFQTALENRVVRKKGIHSHLGDVPSADICVQVADFFTRAYGLGWIFVSGVYQKKVIVIVRNDGYRKNAGNLAIQAFGDLGSAGGHRGAARAEIPLEELRSRNIKGRDRNLAAFIRKRLDF